MYDIIIIGAGPGGISMGVEAMAHGIKSKDILIIEKSEEHSFTIKKYYPEKKLVTANYKGFTPVCTGVMCLDDSTKSETISYLDKAIEDNALKVNYKESVYKIETQDDKTFKIFTDKNIYQSKIVAIAVGILGKPNKPDYRIPREIKKKVYFDLTTFEIKNSKVLVVGGGDSASEYCQFLSYEDENNNVFLSYRKDAFKRMNDINKNSLLSLAEKNKVDLILNSNISSIEKAGEQVKVNFTENDLGSQNFDYVVYALGGSTPENFLKTIGIEFNGPDPILKEGYETNIPGLFLLGDLSAGTKGGSIIWAFNSANTAIKKIINYYL
ncbi:MAG: cbb3-type cytochrome oxidase assembly protein CcoS [Ignavibacteriae bacterium]|nr:MAG: cbb3-type cytochrome oxidase assembly protein CcoS [Ignavibacteriota bacterium]